MGIELDYVFHPSSVAVVGASTSANQGNDFFRFMLGHPFKGALHPINPNAEEIEGVSCFPSVEDVPGPVDYVISAIPATRALQLVDQCARKGVKVIHFYTARMKETGSEEGILLEDELLRRARRAGIRLIGPNCMGMYYPKEGLTFKPGFPTESGPVAAISQSGGNSAQIVNLAAARGVRFSKVLSYGNATDLDESDLLDYLAEDPETEIVAAYMEGVKDGRRFFDVLRRTARAKPVIILKGGRTQAGAKAIASHTASLASSGEVWEAMCRQAGALSVSSMDELIDMMVTFRFMRPAQGVQVGLGGGGGGMSVQSADAFEEAGLRVIPLPPDIQEELKARDPVNWEWIGNPIDVSILGAGPFNFRDILQLIADHPDFDMLVCGIDEQFNLNRPEDVPRAKQTVDMFVEVSRQTSKPMAVVLGADLPKDEWKQQAVGEFRETCVQAGLPVFPTTGRAARAIRRFVDYHRRRLEGETS